MGVPINISSLCRDIHAALTGPKARQRNELKEDMIQYVWDGLDRCWKELDGLRSATTGDAIDEVDMERFIHGWQVCVFSISFFDGADSVDNPTTRFSSSSVVSLPADHP